MGLLRGEQASQALRSCVESSDKLIAVVVPSCVGGPDLPVAAVASESEAFVGDLNSPQWLAEGLRACQKPIASYQAKAVQKRLFELGGESMSRWACARLSEQLIACGEHRDLDFEAVCARYNETSPSHHQSIDGLAQTASMMLRVIHAQAKTLGALGLTRASKIESQAVAAVATMEWRGMPFDTSVWNEACEQDRTECATLAQSIFETLGEANPRDLLGNDSSLLHDDSALKSLLQRHGHQVPNVRKETLRQLPSPLGESLYRYRELLKRVRAYGKNFLRYVGSDGRLHPTFEQIGASTGRMACHEPNLQSIVKDSLHRQSFCAPQGRTLVIADYAACELRILAQMSGDPVFLEAFERGEDLHATVASRVFEQPVSKSTNPHLRNKAKAINFGLVYGMGAGGLARAVGCSVDEARLLLASYFRSFPRIGDFLRELSQTAIKRGYAQTLAGRRLILDPQAHATERIAKNMPIQGTSADMTKIALARVHDALDGNAFLVNTVHDELVVECEETEAHRVAESVKEQMQAAGGELLDRVPVEVDVEISRVWAK